MIPNLRLRPASPVAGLRRIRVVPFFLLLSAACGVQSPEGFAQSLEPRDGTYQVHFQGQSLTLTLVTAEDGHVRGRLQGSTLEFSISAARGIDVDGDPAVEGVMTGGGASGLFWLYLDEDDEYGLIVTPLDAQGTALSDQATLYEVEWNSGEVADANLHSPPSSLSGHPLVGRWATQVIMNTPGGTVATQLFMEFRPDGTLVELGSRAMAGIGGGSLDQGYQGGGEQAVWRTEGNVLQVSYQGSPLTPFARFQVNGTRLGLTYLQDGSVQVWHRQTR